MTGGSEAVGVGYCQSIDCGLLKITDPGEWPAAEMGWTCDLEINEPCISISHPLGYVKDRGAVVRFGRIAELYSPGEGHTQSTCLMEPGDSGGPLFDVKGRVIGFIVASIKIWIRISKCRSTFFDDTGMS